MLNGEFALFGVFDGTVQEHASEFIQKNFLRYHSEMLVLFPCFPRECAACRAFFFFFSCAGFLGFVVSSLARVNLRVFTFPQYC